MKYSIPPFFTLPPDKHYSLIVGNKEINKVSTTVRVILKDPECSACGLEAKYMEVRHEHSRNHLVIISEDGTQFTKDHIKPKSHGGINSFSNYQTMCSPCNTLKGNKSDLKFKNSTSKKVKPTQPLSWIERLYIRYLYGY